MFVCFFWLVNNVQIKQITPLFWSVLVRTPSTVSKVVNECGEEGMRETAKRNNYLRWWMATSKYPHGNLSLISENNGDGGRSRNRPTCYIICIICTVTLYSLKKMLDTHTRFFPSGKMNKMYLFIYLFYFFVPLTVYCLIVFKGSKIYHLYLKSSSKQKCVS